MMPIVEIECPYNGRSDGGLHGVRHCGKEGGFICEQCIRDSEMSYRHDMKFELLTKFDRLYDLLFNIACK